MYNRTIARASPSRSPICCFCATLFQPQLTQCRSFNTTTPLLARRKHKPSAIKILRCKSKKKGSPKAAKPSEGENDRPMTLKEAMLGSGARHFKPIITPDPSLPDPSTPVKKPKTKKKKDPVPPLHIETLLADDLTFEPIEVDKPPVPMLSYGLDRVLFNPGVYLLQDPRSRIFNFDPYLEKVMPVNEFNFDALSEYKTSSKDQDLLNLTKKLGTKFTGSTSSMSSVLQHFHFLLSNFRELNHNMLSRGFPEPVKRFSKITVGPSAIFLRYKDGVYAIDADKTYDSPNIMSWLGHSLEKLLTTDRSEFELYRRSSPEKAPAEDDSSRCYHYSRQGNLLMRSQLDAHDPRLPGTGVFDLKTRAVVSIRMDHAGYEKGTGYQLRFAHGEWESFEREFYDMTRATLLKYSLQVRMGRMDGIFLAFHNIERLFGFQYLSLSDMDLVLHGQSDMTLGDQEFKLSLGLLDELLSKATARFPETSIRLHFEARDVKTKFMYIFAEPVTEEQADDIQSAGNAAQKEFARTVVGLTRDESDVQQAWQSIKEEVDVQLDNDGHDTVQQIEASGPRETTDDSEEGQNTTRELKEEHESQSDEPLAGWTLVARNLVNGEYVDQPLDFTKDDEWKIEYHIEEIPKTSCQKLYAALKERRRKLIGMEDKDSDNRLQSYRNKIHSYSKRGREWRVQQDAKNEQFGVEVYKPLGPGSESMRGREG